MAVSPLFFLPDLLPVSQVQRTFSLFSLPIVSSPAFVCLALLTPFLKTLPGWLYTSPVKQLTITMA